MAPRLLPHSHQLQVFSLCRVRITTPICRTERNPSIDQKSEPTSWSRRPLKFSKRHKVGGKNQGHQAHPGKTATPYEYQPHPGHAKDQRPRNSLNSRNHLSLDLGRHQPYVFRPHDSNKQPEPKHHRDPTADFRFQHKHSASSFNDYVIHHECIFSHAALALP